MKISYMGKRTRLYRLKALLRRAWLIAKLTTAATVALVTAAAIGALCFSTATVTYATTEVKAPPLQIPVLDRIADCESGNGHPHTATQFRNGQVLVKPNTNGTVDMGKYQINSIWFKQAAALGFDLSTEEGNRSMAMWIYTNKGTGDWSASAHCWNH